MKPQVAVQRTTDATVLEENYRRTPTVLGHLLVDLLRAAIVPEAPAVVAALLLMAMLAEGAPHTGLAEESVAEAITEAKATQTATSLVPHTAATTLAAELKKSDARSPPRQARTTASPPSLLDFAICCSQRNSSLWGSLSTTQSKTQYSGLDATPSPSRTLVETTT
jgi:hypothetical protein